MSETVPPLPIDSADHAAKEALGPGDPAFARAATHRSSAPLARRSFFSDVPDKGLFLLFASVGFVATFAAKFNGITGLPTALAAIAVLVAYALVSSRLEWFKLHPDRLGDNCYYMGFLFTLASLSAALVGIETRAGEARDALVEGLIGSFGVALFSTIGGITLRVWFMQLRREVEDIEEVIRNDLQEAARHLKDQLGDAVQNLEGFRVRTGQVMEEQFTSVLAEFSKASKALAEHVEASGAAHVAASERLTVNAGQVAQEIRRLVERVEKVDIPSDLLTRQVEAARLQLDALVSSLSHAARHDAERQAATERAAASLDRLLQRMSDLSAFDVLEISIQRLGSGAEAAGAAMEGVSEKLGAHAASVAAVAAQAERDGATIAKARSALEADLAESTTSLHKLHGSLATVAENLVKQLGG